MEKVTTDKILQRKFSHSKIQCQLDSKVIVKTQ